MLATYSDPGGWLEGKAAAVTRSVGAGRITYLGGWFDDALLGRIAGRLLGEAGITPAIAGAHPDLEVSQRTGSGKKVVIVINHGNEARPLRLPVGASLVTGDYKGGTIPGHGVAVATLPQAGAAKR